MVLERSARALFAWIVVGVTMHSRTYLQRICSLKSGQKYILLKQCASESLQNS